jgi:hypothetical protein
LNIHLLKFCLGWRWYAVGAAASIEGDPGYSHQVREPIGAVARRKIFIGYDFRADRHRWLEYQWASARFRPLAVPFTFATAFCKRNESPVAAFGGKC